MTPEQGRILRPIYKSVAHHNKHVWWELKRQIFDWGYRDHYPWELEFSGPAKRALANLSETDRSVLIADWRHENSDGVARTDEMIIEIYGAIVVEEVVRRAGVAAMRTSNW